MKLIVSLTIDGDPVSKQRPRIAVQKSGRVYTPKGTRAAQKAIAWEIRMRYRDLAPYQDGVFSVRCSFFIKTYQRRDLDNMCKLVLDACNGIVWRDDVQVEELYAKVTRGDARPRTELIIYHGEARTPRIACEVCGRMVRTHPSTQDRRFCSKACSAQSMRKGGGIPCVQCGRIIHRAPHRTERQYCSTKCKSLHRTVELACRGCSSTFRKPRSLAGHGYPFCSPSCRQGYWRAHPPTSGGVCAACGGPTSRRGHRTCWACRQETSDIYKQEIDPEERTEVLVEDFE